MGGDDGQWPVRFPELFRDLFVDYAQANVSFTTEVVPDDLVSRLHLVAVTTQAKVIVCRTEQGGRFLPGGTREPEESLADLARRELIEEAGARLAGEMRYFAAHMADSTRPQPYRPHLPHPRTYWAYAVARAEVIAAPTNPPDGEQVVEVLTLAPALAARFIAEHDQLHADVLRLADAMGLIRSAQSTSGGARA
jgi:8-oxo-dGTP diphosphatase